MSVIISQFELDYSSDRWIPYRLSCYVVNATDSTIEDPTGTLSESAPAQISDVIGLLDYAAVKPTSDQTAALLALATLGFDTPPSGMLEQAKGLIDAIDTQLVILGDAFPNGVSSDQTPSIDVASCTVALVSNYGQEVSLILGRNRVKNVMICAENTDQ